MTIEGKVLCDARVASCRCREASGHYHYPDSPHKCDPRCGGSWWGSGEHFEIVSLPKGVLVPGIRYDEDW